MQIFHYHPDTGVYLGQGQADADPMVQGNWLIPASATIIAPPDEQEGQQRVFRGDKWGYQQDLPPIAAPEPDAQAPG